MSTNSRRSKHVRRHQLLQASGWRCVYCSRGLNRATVTVDHVVPKKLGGLNVPSNQVAACQRCNVAKGHRMLGEWQPPNPLPMLALMPRQAVLAHRAAEPQAA